MRRVPLLALALAGCTVGPRPVATTPLPPARPSELIASASGEAQRITVGAVPLAGWWHAFGSTKLDALVAAAFAHNNDLQVADAALRQAAEQARATAGGQGPQVDANYQAQRVRISQTFSNPLSTDPNAYIYTLHTAQVTVAYPLDLFGLGRNRVRSARAAAAVAGERLRAARTTAVAALVVAVIQHAAFDAEAAAQRDAIASDRTLVTLLQRRQALGDVGAADVAAQETVLATAEAALPPLERQRDHQAGLIASLTGTPAGSPPAPLPSLDELRLPADLPLALPADIVANRPDVLAAAAQLRGAAADLGAAIAARLPAAQLTGTFGGQATRITDLFAGPNLFYTLLGSLTQPIFHSGQLLHQQRAARAELDGAEAQYRVAALQAFLDVDDALAGLRTDAAALDAAARADTAATRTLGFQRRQLELGAVGTLQLLNAESAARQAAVGLIQARAARLADTVALFQACGTPTDPPAAIGRPGS